MGVFNHDLSAMCLCWHCRCRHRWTPAMTKILNIDTYLINKLYIKSKCIEVYGEGGGGSHLGLAKLVNFNQILGSVADQDYVEFVEFYCIRFVENILFLHDVKYNRTIW